MKVNAARKSPTAGGQAWLKYEGRDENLGEQGQNRLTQQFIGNHR